MTYEQERQKLVGLLRTAAQLIEQYAIDGDYGADICGSCFSHVAKHDSDCPIGIFQKDLKESGLLEAAHVDL